MSKPAARTSPLRPSWTWIDVCVATLLAAATFSVYAAIGQHEFVSFDDPAYVTANAEVQAGLTWHGVQWAFTATHDANWFPLTWLSHMADVQLFGLDSGSHHLVSLFLHALSTVLLFLALTRLTGARWPSALVAGLFGLHPLHVESVAWAAERKDVLSGLFWMLALLGYAAYVRRPDWKRYLLVLVPFALGLMAKSMIVTLPFVLLLLDVWPLGRLTFARRRGRTGAAPRAPAGAPSPARRLLFEKLPLFALAAAGSAVIYVAQRGGGAVAPLDQVPAITRLANALVSYGAYAAGFVWPSRLAVFYPYQLAIPAWQPLLAAAGLGAVSLVAIRRIRTLPFLAVGWFWFLGTLVPVIGLVQIGNQSRADRYTYIPLIGLAIVLAWSLDAVARRAPTFRAALAGLAVAFCAASSILASQQVQHWRNSESLYRHALAVTDGNFLACDGLGTALKAQGRLDEAIDYHREAVRIRPLFAGARTNLGVALLARGRAQEAVEQLREAVRLRPEVREARIALAIAAASLQQGEEEAVQLREAIRLAPDNTDLHYSLARVLAAQGRADELITELQTVLRLQPGFAEGHFNLGNALASRGRLDEAIAEYATAVRLKPEDARARCNLGTALATAGRLDEAIAQFSEALRLQPNLAEARQNLEAAQGARGVRSKIERFPEPPPKTRDFGPDPSV